MRLLITTFLSFFFISSNAQHGIFKYVPPDTVINQKPIANAGTDKAIQLPTNSVNLSGSGIDYDGTITAYFWSKISGAGGTITSPFTALTTFNSLTQGTYVLQLRVTDNIGDTAVDQVTVVVNPATNIPPVANAGVNKSITLPVNSTSVTGTATDADGTIVSTVWSQIGSLPSVAFINTPFSLTTTLSNLVEGTYDFQLLVTDNNGGTSTDIMRVVVNPAIPPVNVPPTANAGSNIVITLPTSTTTLTGSGTDPDGTIVSYHWDDISAIPPVTSSSTFFGNDIQGPTETSINGSGIPTAWPQWNPTTLRLFNYAYSTTQGTYKTFWWRDIETASGVYDWTVFDKILLKYKSKNVTDLIFVLGRVPSWAGGGVDGNTPPSSQAYVTSFITAVANRAISLGLPIKYWEIWNEPNNGSTSSWNGTINQMVTLAQTVYNAVKAVSNTYKTISPSCQGYSTDTTRLSATTILPSTNGTRWMSTFLSSGGGAYCDIMGFHAYMGGRIPEAIDTLISTYKIIYAANGQSTKEIWCTEGMDINAGYSPTEQSKYLAINYILQYIKGVSRYYWYSWDSDDGREWNYLTGIDSTGLANQQIINWMQNATVDSLVESSGIYTARVMRNGVRSLIVWNKGGSSSYSTSFTQSTTLFGSVNSLSGSVTIGKTPILLSNSTGGTITSPNSATTGITGLTQGVYLYQLTVTDNNGSTGTDIVQVTVNGAANIPPVANAGPDLVRTLPIDTSTLFGSATDADGTIASYGWTKVISSPALGNINNPTSATTTLSNLAWGVYTLQLAVIDNSGAVAYDTVRVTVNPAVVPPTANGRYDYVLDTVSHVSIAVFKTTGQLFKTIVSDTIIAAGSYTGYWDGTDDNGVTVPVGQRDTGYVVKVLSNNVKYEWHGTLGNTSDSMIGHSKHRGYSNCMTGLCFGSTYGYGATGYSEGASSLFKFLITKPQIKIPLFETGQITGNINLSCTDGTNVYWAVIDSYSDNNTFVIATKVSDDTQLSFASGVPYNMIYGRTWSSVIAKRNQLNAKQSGMAVQRTGNFLFVAYADLNTLTVVNKTTGQTVQNLTFTNPRGLSTDASNNLWMISNNQVQKFSVNASTGALTATLLTLSGITTPLATQVSPDGLTVAVTDGNTEQVRFFNNTTGAGISTLGTSGGYRVDATVTNIKFMFTDRNTNTRHFVAYQPDGSYWVNDAGNYRIQHFNSSNTFVDNIAYLGSSYATWADKNNITRVFESYREYAIDYSVQTLTGSTGWTLSKNWGANVDPTVYDNSHRGISPITLSNGRTYTFIQKGGNNEIAELVAGGTMRFTNILKTRTFNNSYLLCDDGSLQQSEQVGSNYVYRRYALTGFDGSNNPTWSSTPEILATAATDNVIGNPVTTPNAQMFSGTGNSVVVYNYNPFIGSVLSTGYHLGLLARNSTNSYLFQTERPTHLNYIGAYPGAGWFEGGNGVNYSAGSSVSILDSNIFTAYHGEFWKGMQTNKYNHYYLNGMAIQQFGVVRTSPDAHTFAGMAGNALTPVWVKDGNGNLYLYHGDESDHSAVHRWKITRLNTIKMQTIPMAFPSAYTPIVKDYTELWAGLPFDQTLVSGTAGWTRTGVDTVGRWTVNTGRKQYDRFKHNDIYVEFQSPVPVTYNVRRDLGTNNVSTNWMIAGQLDFGILPNGTGNNAYLEVLDVNGVALTRAYSISFSEVAGAYINTQKVLATALPPLTGLTPFELSITSGVVTFKYGTYTFPTTTVLGGDWTKPKTLQIRFLRNANPNFGVTYDLTDPIFKKDYL